MILSISKSILNRAYIRKILECTIERALKSYMIWKNKNCIDVLNLLFISHLSDLYLMMVKNDGLVVIETLVEQ